MVALGSDRSVHASDDPWIAAEIAFLRDAHQSDVAVLGVCFGAQALAAALGGCVAPAPCAEIGWYELAAPGRGPVGAGPWFEWHFDAFTLPSGAHELARTAAGAQAFRLGRSVGLQFHPEVTPAIVDGWLRTGRGDLDAQALDGESIRRQTARQAGAARRRAFALFDAIADGWG